MSGWGLGGWFGGSASAKKKDAPKEAILGLRSTLEMLTKREKHIENSIDEQDGLARKYVNTNKAGKLCDRKSSWMMAMWWSRITRVVPCPAYACMQSNLTWQWQN